MGDSLSSSQHPDVFVSTDGGYNWRGTLRGPHHYSILDSGGLVVAVEAHHEGQVKTIKYCTDMFAGFILQLISGDPRSNFVANVSFARFSTDEGQCWKSYNFTEQPFFFAGLASEPGTKALSVSVWGFRPEDDGQPMWVAVTIDFQSLITRECEYQCQVLNIYYYYFSFYFGSVPAKTVEGGCVYSCAPPEGARRSSMFQK